MNNKKTFVWIGIAVALTICLGFFLTDSPTPKTSAAETDSLALAPESSKATLYCNIPVDSLLVIEEKVKKNQNLSEILNAYHISPKQIHLLAQRAKSVFSVRKIVSGKPYALLCTRDSLPKATHFIYKPNPVDYIVYDLRDSMQVYKRQRKVTIKEKEITGTIQSSLYQALLQNGGSQLLVNKLADVFAWQIDFFHIQKNDYFKILYEEKWVENKMVGIGKVLAAQFNHMNTPYYAFYFGQGGKASYFDEKGNSLRKAFLKAPLNYTRISSRFSKSRYHPVQKRYKAHKGTDYAAPRGTPIRSVGEGTVIKATYNRYNGNYVKIRHNSVYTTQYLHMSKIKSGIRSGKKVKQGDIIGFVGSTGLASGPHLCFRFWKNGEQVDALKIKLPPSEPVLKENIATFQQIAAKWKNRLDQLQIHFNDSSLAIAE
ncbi:MAG: peptidoglycan DD-metalloendopeptidase family protein [Cytophagales bacterium]|nr:peptidoglycan DD-metalloendopeptidase family protein [Cytophagales bacterium]